MRSLTRWRVLEHALLECYVCTRALFYTRLYWQRLETYSLRHPTQDIDKLRSRAMDYAQTACSYADHVFVWSCLLTDLSHTVLKHEHSETFYSSFVCNYVINMRRENQQNLSKVPKLELHNGQKTHLQATLPSHVLLPWASMGRVTCSYLSKACDELFFMLEKPHIFQKS